MRYRLRVERAGCHSAPPLASVSLNFDRFAGTLWATSHRGEGLPRCKMSHDASATRLDFGAPRVEWWGLLLLLSTLGIVVMVI